VSGQLAADEIHVWTVPLVAAPAEFDRLGGLLSDSERERAARYVYAPAREQFTITRARLRLLLGSYLGLDPARIMFGTSNTGKPTLPGTSLSFNVSHTQGLALIALTAGREIGVDIERVRTQPTHLDMATRYFTPGESQRLNALPPTESERAFFHVWTRKEAFLKAIGLGLSHGLERFEVSVPPDEPCRLLHIDGDAGVAAGWTLLNLELEAGYVGALAVEGRGYRVRLMDWIRSPV
jgi:4'-phosphopantetheinyl transferase